MKQAFLKRKLLAVALTGAIGISGAAIAQQSPATSPSTPSATTSPSNTTNGGTTRTDTAGGGMSSKGLSRTESADSAWQKLGSKGYVTKDDVKDLSGFSFDTADANHDGRLTVEEFRQAWQTYSGSPAGGTSVSPSTPSGTSMSPSTSGGMSAPSSTGGATTSGSPSSGNSSQGAAPK